MAKWLIPALIGIAGAAGIAPAHAQTQNGVLVIYGDDVCPTDSNGNEIVVCSRRPEDERYRIPKELRDEDVPPQRGSWATRVDDVRNAGENGVGSCSAVGAGGFTGCTSQMINRGKQEYRQRRDAADEAGK